MTPTLITRFIKPSYQIVTSDATAVSSYAISPRDLSFDGTTSFDWIDDRGVSHTSESLRYAYRHVIDSITGATITGSSSHWANTATTYGSGDWASLGDYVPETPAQKFLREMRARMASCNIVVKNRPYDLAYHPAPAEARARALLREMIGERNFHRYIKRGFITAMGRSGTLYRISGGHEKIVSYTRGPSGKLEPFESFCVVFKSCSLPFTDGVIMRKLIVEHDEFNLRKLANVWQIRPAIKAA